MRRGVGVGRDQRHRGVEQGADRHLVSGLGAGGELHRDLDRQRAGLEQDAGCLAVERAARGDRHAGADRLARDVVPEGQPFVSLDEQVRLEELTDRREQVRGGPSERPRQLVEGERATERRGDGHGVARLVGEPAEPLAHPHLHAPGELAVDQLGVAVDETDPVLLSQAEEGLDDEERVAVALRQLVENRLIGRRGEHVRRQLHDRLVLEWAEDDRLRAASLQLLERTGERRRFARRPEGDDPRDRQSHESHRQGANRRRRPAVCPLGIVDGDQERRLERRALEQLLQVSQQPEPLLGVRVERGEPVVVEQRLRTVEQRCQQCRELDDRLVRIGGAAPHSDAEATSHRRHLREQAALAHAGGALDDEHGLGAVGEAFELGSNQRELRVASVDLPRWARRHPLLEASISEGERELSNHRIVRCAPAPPRPHSPLPQREEGSGRP